jgi:hypothetical protein
VKKGVTEKPEEKIVRISVRYAKKINTPDDLMDHLVPIAS